MFYFKKILIFIAIFNSLILLNSCGKPVDAKKFPPDPKLRVKKNLEEGRGFRLDNAIENAKGGNSGSFDFASSNELWKASLDVLDFMPLTSVNYSGGIIISDWYNNGDDPSKSIKVSIRFLSDEVRADALNVKVFYRNCTENFKCTINQEDNDINKELKKEIIKKAAVYEKQKKDKNFKPYNVTPKKSADD